LPFLSCSTRSPSSSSSSAPTASRNFGKLSLSLPPRRDAARLS
jgi:hypothetical protein